MVEMPFFGNVKSFCEKHDIEVLDMTVLYKSGRARSQSQQDHVTIEHHYQIDIFVDTLNSQL